MNAPEHSSKNDTHDLVVEFLRERDVACPMCGYNLRGQTSSICPECGTEAQLELRPVSPRMAAWITGLAGLAAGFGFNCMILGWGLLEWNRNAFVELEDLWSLLLGVVTCGALAAVWIKASRSLRRSHAMVRWGLAISCWMLWIGFSVVFFWIVEP